MAEFAPAFRRALLRWYRKHGRHNLPWRHTRDPYAILVSEIMLQQTQVATVLPYFEAWLKRFPNVRALARAPENDVLHAWQGLGYYSRARNLQAAAKAVTEIFGGKVPDDVAELRSLPGVGRYTANAVATFSFDQPVPVVDANIGRLVSRIFDIRVPSDTSAGREEVWKRAGELIPAKNAGRFNSALMDLGATVCLPRNPRCGVCAVKPFCRAQDPLSLPRKAPRPQLKKLREDHALIIKRKRILLQQCEQRWRGMWMLPAAISPNKAKPLHVARFPFTNHQITLRVFETGSNGTSVTQRWFALPELDRIPIPSPHRRAIEALLKR